MGGKRRECHVAVQPGPLHFGERVRHVRLAVARRIDHDRQQERPAFRHEVRALVGEPPFQSEIPLGARLRSRRNHRREQRSLLYLLADLRIPRIAADEFALVEPDLYTARP